MASVFFLTAALGLLCAPTHYVFACYDGCMQKFSVEMSTISTNTNNSAVLTASFCKAMAHQLECLHAATRHCSPQQKMLLQNMLAVFIQPDYQRTCVDNGSSTSSSLPIGVTGTAVAPTSGTIPAAGLTGTPMEDASQTFVLCTQKIQTCHGDFNTSLAAAGQGNIHGICQALKKFTVCIINLMSSGCGQMMRRNLAQDMQAQYGTMCSNDAQANTQDLIDCTDDIVQCFGQFNTTFAPAVLDYNLVLMCGAIAEYTTCVHTVSQRAVCAQFAAQSLAGLAQLKAKHSAYCGEDNGQTAAQCVQSFQDCFAPFNQTFFPALHSANLTKICSSLESYTSCVSRLTPMCSQQMGHVIQSAQSLKLQYSSKCHPSILKLSTCEAVGHCSHTFIKTFSEGLFSNTGMCGRIGDYFPCVERSLDACNLPQSTTEIEFGALGTLMHGYCEKVSTSVRLTQCPAFVKCTTAIMVSFSPTLKNMYEGSTWCTFLQLSIGCAEHALQSTGCFLDQDKELHKRVTEMDMLRMRTCEKRTSADNSNMVNAGRASDDKDGGKGGAAFPQSSVLYPVVTSVILVTMSSGILV
ncbi:hypothetical protein RRG08_054100 [Elysia crispata]|uniref:Uncharacterized protein n=1 Tax=Elysia crispata TaxID=231223 RepID=A0AAE0ZES8_9GAST|nr:hypothetical protein RRG08_054100 [Elysia crispata]